MIVKKYLVDSVEEGKELVFKELGPNAVVMTSRQIKYTGIKSLFCSNKVQVVAAVHDTTINFENPSIEPVVTPYVTYAEPPAPVAPAAPVERPHQPIKMTSLMFFLAAKGISLPLAEVIESEVSDALADVPYDVYDDFRAFPEKVQQVLIQRVAAHLRIAVPLHLRKARPTIAAFVGLSGVGKTAALLKIALQHRSTFKLQAAIISYAAAESESRELSVVGARGIPLTSVRNLDELADAVESYAGSGYDLILIDTNGADDALFTALSCVENLHTHLVISATTKDPDVDMILKRFARFKPECAIFTKLDETSSLGLLVNTCEKTGLPISYTTDGSEVASEAAVKAADAEAIALRILQETHL